MTFALLDDQQRPPSQFDLPAPALPGNDSRAATPADNKEPLFTSRMFVGHILITRATGTQFHDCSLRLSRRGYRLKLPTMLSQLQ